MGLSYSADCRLCHVEEVTTEHLMCEFQVWVGLQQKVVGSAYPRAGQLEKLDPGRLALLADRPASRYVKKKNVCGMSASYSDEILMKIEVEQYRF